MEVFDEEPTPAIFDAEENVNGIDPDDFEGFVKMFKAEKRQMALRIAVILCHKHQAKSLDALVNQPHPQKGPLSLIEHSEELEYLPNYEELVLKAVQSNDAAAAIFLAWFAKVQFIRMEFFEEILDVAIETDKKSSLSEKNLPESLEDYENEVLKTIAKFEKIKALTKKLANEDYTQIKNIPKSYQVAAVTAPQRLIIALEKIIEHHKHVLAELKKIFAK